MGYLSPRLESDRPASFAVKSPSSDVRQNYRRMWAALSGPTPTARSKTTSVRYVVDKAPPDRIALAEVDLHVAQHRVVDDVSHEDRMALHSRVHGIADPEAGDDQRPDPDELASGVGADVVRLRSSPIKLG